MNRREFLTTTALGLAAHSFAGPGYRTPAEAIKAPREKLLHVIALYGGTGIDKPDYLATVDVDPESKNFSKVIHRLPMPKVDDELHHFGWNACSSCHAVDGKERRYYIVPGVKSSRIHIIDAADPAAPKLHKVIEPDVVVKKTGLTAPHTVHCLPDGKVLLSMLGDADGNGPGGFMLLDENFDVAGRWEKNAEGMKYNYDFWYQPQHNVMVSSEWGAPKTFTKGFNPDDVKAGKYGSQIHFWNWNERRIQKTINLGETGLIPLEVRFLHNPTKTNGYVGAALSSTMWHFHKTNDAWQADKVIVVETIEVKGVNFPVPGLITDLVVSMDDRFLYFSNWLHGDIRQYDISDPAKPKLTGQVWVGGMIGKSLEFRGQKLRGGPQMLQLSLDGKRLYVTNSLLRDCK